MKRILAIRLTDDFSSQDIQVISTIGESIDDLHDAFRTFALAAGFNPDTVKEYFSQEELA